MYQLLAEVKSRKEVRLLPRAMARLVLQGKKKGDVGFSAPSNCFRPHFRHCILLPCVEGRNRPAWPRMPLPTGPAPRNFWSEAHNEAMLLEVALAMMPPSEVSKLDLIKAADVVGEGRLSVSSCRQVGLQE